MRIIFFYNSYVLGGVENLFSSIVNDQSFFLKENKHVRFYIFCNSEDSIYQKLVPEGCKVCNLNDLTRSDVVITPLSNMYNLYREFPSLKAKLIFWSLHPLNSVALTPGIVRFNKRSLFRVKFFNKAFFLTYFLNKYALERLVDLGAIYFMDDESINALYYFYSIKVDRDLLIPLFSPGGINCRGYFDYYFSSIGSKKAIWIGRDDDFKTIPLTDFLSKGLLLDWELTLVGFKDNKENQDKFKRYVRRLSLYEKINPEDIESFVLNDNFELGLGMGLSSIGLASFGIPVVLVNPAYHKGNAMHPIKLYQSKGYSLGSFKEFSRSEGIFNKGVISFTYEDILRQKEFLELFSQEQTFLKLIEAVNNSKAYFDKFYYYLKLNIFQVLYGKYKR